MTSFHFDKNYSFNLSSEINFSGSVTKEKMLIYTFGEFEWNLESELKMLNLKRKN